MRKMYTTKRLLGAATVAAAVFLAGPAAAQKAGNVEVEEEALDGDAPAGKDGQSVKQRDTGEIDLHVKELEITKVLQLLSIQSKRNIIASRGVEKAKVSADLYGVSFEQALTSILEPNDFGYIEEGNFIYVLTKDEIKKRKEADRKITTKIYRLDYLRASEASKFVTPMLSDAGAITASGDVKDGFQPGIDDGGADSDALQPTLVIRDYEDNVAGIETVLKQLDIQPKQVIIEATILTATLNENNALGVDFSLFTDLTGASPLNLVDNAIASGSPNNQRFAAGDSNVGGVAAQSGGAKIGFVAGDAAVFVKALDSVTDTTLIATPKLTVLDRQRADVLVGDKIAYLSTTVTETSETQTVEFLEVGVQFTARPFVTSDGKVRLELRPSVSDATIRTIGSTSAPDESTVELVTNVIVDSGQTIVLGGLFTDDSTVSRSQVPGLGEIPLFGNAFRGQSDDVDRSEVIFMVKATVVENETLIKLGKEGMDRVSVARLAEREQLLPWSRSKLTAAHMVNARKHYDEAMTLTGKQRDEKMADARFSVDLALHMNPSMVDALILKEKITGEAAYIKYEESIVTETYDAVLNEEMKALGIPAMPEPEAKADEPLVEPEAVAEGEASTAEGADATAQAEEKPAQPEADGLLDAALEEEFSDAKEAPEEPAEVPADESEQADASDSEEPGEAWRELTTAELLQLASEEAEKAEAESEEESAEAESEDASDSPEPKSDNETADVPTETE